MGLVFCSFCGNHDVCPSEMLGGGGSVHCDMCGQVGIHPCGKCDACKDEYGMEGSEKEGWEENEDDFNF